MPATSHDATRLHEILNRTLGLLEDAGDLVARAGIRPADPARQMLGRASSEILQARRILYEAAPTLLSGVAVKKSVPPPVASPVASTAGTRFQRRRWLFPRRPRVVLGTTGDIIRMGLRLFVPWRLPQIEVGFHETLTPSQLQRAQHRIRMRSDACQRMVLGPWLAALAVMTGAFIIVWRWRKDFNDLLLVVMAAGAAWLVGNVVNMAWCRLPLLVELLRLWRRVALAGRALNPVAQR